MTTIAAIRSSDRDEWLPLWQAYLTFSGEDLPQAVTDDVFRRIVEGRDLHGAIARDEQGEPVGIVHWLFHPSTWSTAAYCSLEDLYVDAVNRGGGVGRALIAHVRAAAAEAGAAKVHWLTQETNTAARALYDRVAESTGFVHYEARP